MALDDVNDDEIARREEQTELVETRKPKKRLPIWLDRPYHVWRDQFQKDKCCSKKMVKQELMFASLYLLFLNAALAIYVFFGSQVFRLRHMSSNEEATLLDRALFCITTISTIGYGNIVPSDDREKVICILYCVAGIPLFFMTVATNSVLFVDVCCILHRSFSSKNVGDSGFRWYTSGLLLVVHCFIGSFIFSLWIDELDLLNAFYFSFISITTIGYGDFSPTPEGAVQYAAVVIYLCTGVATMLLFFSSLQKGIMWIHYYGRQVSESENAEIWFGGQMMTVRDLVTLVARKFGSTPEKLREVLHDLDKILEVACRQVEAINALEEERHLVENCADTRKTVLLSGCSDGDDCQVTIHSFTSNNQRSIPKDTELAILALGTIQHHLRKPSVRSRAGHYARTPIVKPASDTNIIESHETARPPQELDLSTPAPHRTHSDGALRSTTDDDSDANRL